MTLKEESGWFKGKGEVSRCQDSVSRDPERNVHTVHSRTARSATRQETCAGEEEKAEWKVGDGRREVGGVPKVRGQPTPSSVQLIGPEAPVPSALTPQP